jgi:8-oxo-dGTP diphosphatase
MTVRAAGGVVWRRRPSGELEVLLVHRPAYDDWSLPKGKADGEEPDEVAALREVEEETGLRCQLGPPLPATSYRDRQGRPKVVRYWAMHPVAGQAGGHHEVDAVRWLPIAEAIDALSYERDRAVLDALPGALGSATPS